MKLMRSFLHLPSKEKKILIKSYFYMWFVQIILWLLPLPRCQQIIRSLSKKKSPEISDKKDYMDKILWSVMVASQYIPKAKCLTRTLTAYILLKRHNYPVEPKIGVLMDDNGNLKAHAWLEKNGEVVLGITNSKYQTLDFKW